MTEPCPRCGDVHPPALCVEPARTDWETTPADCKRWWGCQCSRCARVGELAAQHVPPELAAERRLHDAERDALKRRTLLLVRVAECLAAVKPSHLEAVLRDIHAELAS